jgi:hypothetical protein
MEEAGRRCQGAIIYRKTRKNLDFLTHNVADMIIKHIDEETSRYELTESG